MLIDITYKASLKDIEQARQKEDMSAFGHIGTHFDVMDSVFPLEYTVRDAVVFDVSRVPPRDIDTGDIDISLVKEDMFVAFSTGYIEDNGYGEGDYFTGHPRLTFSLIDELIGKKVSIIGVDFTGIRRPPEHIGTDIKCAEHGVFVVENLCGLKSLLKGRDHAFFRANTYPVSFEGLSGLPCRVIAEI